LNSYKALGHLFTFVTIAIWSTAFVGNKVLLAYLTPIEIMIFRFALAYVVMLIIYPKFTPFKSIKDELFFFLLGLLGVFIYFLLENFALKYTQATNVGLFMGAIPILTAFASYYINKDERITKNLIIGFIIAFIGIAMILLEGREFKIRFIGDMLAFLGAITFALYSAILKRAPKDLNSIVITRKSFFYGLILMLLYYLIDGNSLNFQALKNPVVYGNIIYLGLFSSGLAYILYQQGVKRIGAISASNYIYLVPLLTAITGVIVLNEQITTTMLIAGALILMGLYIAQKR